MGSINAPSLDWWQEMVRKREEEERATYVFADKLKLASMSFQQHDNHLRNVAHYNKLLKDYALRLSKMREITPETLEGLSETERLWVFEIQRMECYESEMAIRRAGIEAMQRCLDRYEGKEKFNEYALEKVKSYRVIAETLRAKKSPDSISPPTRPGPITRLPPELIRMILKDCCAKPTIAKAARVCREWNHIAMPILYNSVDLGEGVELELWVVNGSEYRWYKEGRDRSDARIASMPLSIRLLHTLSTTPYVRYVRRLSYRGLSRKSALERWPDSSTRECYGEAGTAGNLMLTKLRKKTINQMIASTKKVARLLIHIESLELSGNTDFRVLDALLGVLKWRPIRQLKLCNTNIRACHFDRREVNYSITTLELQHVIYYFTKDKRRRLGSAEANRQAKIRGTLKIMSLILKCMNLRNLCITGCQFGIEELLQSKAYSGGVPEICFPKLSQLQLYSLFDGITWDDDLRTQFHCFMGQHRQLESLVFNARLLAKLMHENNSIPNTLDHSIVPYSLRKIEIDHIFLGTEAEHNIQVHLGLPDIKQSLPYAFSRMPLLEELQFANFPWDQNFLQKCLQALRNSPKLKILRIMELCWDVTLPILQDIARLSPRLEELALESEKIFDGEKNYDDPEPFDVTKLAQTLSPLYNLRILSMNYAIQPTTPAIIAAFALFHISPGSQHLIRVLARLRDSDPNALRSVREEYLAIVSGVVRAFARRFLRLDYLNLAVWESVRCSDENEIALLRIGKVQEGRKCIGWKQVLPTRGMGKLDVRLDEVGGYINVNEK